MDIVYSKCHFGWRFEPHSNQMGIGAPYLLHIYCRMKQGMSSAADQPARPDLIAWEVSDPDDRPSEEDKIRSIVEELARFGDGQRILLTGIDHASRTDIHTIVDEARTCDLEVVLSPEDPRLIDRTFIRSLAAAGLTGVSITLDGPDRESHDEFNGGVGKFNAAIRIARWAHEFGLSLEVETTVTRSTVDGIDHLAAKILALDADRWTLSFIVPSNRGVEFAEVYPSQSRQLLEWVATIDANHDVTISIAHAPMYHRVIASEDESGTSTSPASTLVAGDSLLYIGPDGTVSPAGTMTIDLGQLPQDDLIELYRRNSLLQAIRDPSSRKGMCGACEFAGICGGSRARAYSHFGDPLAQDPMCPFIPENVEVSE